MRCFYKAYGNFGYGVLYCNFAGKGCYKETIYSLLDRASGGGISMRQMKRWEELYVELQRKAERLGYDPPMMLGESDNSQTYEYRIGRKPVLLIAFRDLGRKPDYARPDRLWAEGLDLVLNRYLAIARAAPGAELPPAIAIVIDNIGESYVVVPMNELIELYRARMKQPQGRGRHFTFVVEHRAGGYFLVMPDDRPNVPLTHVDSMKSVVDLLKELKAQHTARQAGRS
jgi:hypothetical protein